MSLPAIPSVKDDVRALLDQLPEDATYDDVMDALFLRWKVARALDDVRTGRTYSQEEIDAEFGE